MDTSENGIFEWDDVTLFAIKEWRISGTEMEKRFVLVAYLLELVYDLERSEISFSRDLT